MTVKTETVAYFVGMSGRIVCNRADGCAGATLTAALAKHPNAAAWRGLNGEPFERMIDADVAEIRAITGGTACDCEYTR